MLPESSWGKWRYRTDVREGPVARARAALARGDVLIAYDESLNALADDGADLEAQFLAALALARAGATERAQHEAAGLVTRIDQDAQVPVALREDAEALVARLAKDRALRATEPERAAGLRHAAALYEATAERFGGFYSLINAATLSLLAGDDDHAHKLARRTQILVQDDRKSRPEPDYWREATDAEATLVLGDVAAAREALNRAVAIAGDDLASLAATRRQLRLICDAVGTECVVLDGISAPTIVHYCGHRVDFSLAAEESVASSVKEYLSPRRVAFAYGSLASGADIVLAEALIEHGAQLHVVLPFAAEEFDRVSVAPAGPEWSRRFYTCLEQASSTVFASDSAYMHDDELFGYAGRIAMGHALNRAAFLDAPAEQLAIWDETAGAPVAGTAHDVAVWRRTGHPTAIIPLPEECARSGNSNAEQRASRHIGAILFTDFRGFSRLRDEHFPVFVNNVFTQLGAELDRHADDVLWRNSWGDAIAAVFADVTAAADCALGLHDVLRNIDLAALGLPADLDLRIGAHAGPVLAIADPIARRQTYWGRELTRAARIEPRTPEGEVYVTDAFAALLALEPDAPFATEYVGRITTAKDFETVPMYRLHRDAQSAGEFS
jgi:hypothetical protein